MSTRTWFTLTAACALLAAGPAFAQQAHDHTHGGPPAATKKAVAKATPTARTIEVKVTNEFAPAEVHVKKGEKVNLVFTRTTDRTCATSVHFKDLGVNQDLPLNKPVTVSVSTAKAGKYRYACSMDMIAGTLVVD